MPDPATTTVCQQCGRSGWALAASWDADEAPRGCDECYVEWAQRALARDVTHRKWRTGSPGMTVFVLSEIVRQAIESYTGKPAQWWPHSELRGVVFSSAGVQYIMAVEELQFMRTPSDVIAEICTLFPPKV